ncbi:hypothetical protein L1987_55288 [Smallanthus sonchifolius]|uniref:Uncharacterized protein n=1 Tax=Smallanthus sonchifolius TaxID=185202 RepID=A0ACB9EAK1_9ASTR|nr:hypothetical protein L1987_55288 [Smallanthus sonchifolius]
MPNDRGSGGDGWRRRRLIVKSRSLWFANHKVTAKNTDLDPNNYSHLKISNLLPISYFIQVNHNVNNVKEAS